MKKRVLFSASFFHGLNDAAAVTVPMIFPLLYSQQLIIKKYSHIGILSTLGLLITFIFQIVLANYAHRFEYKHIIFFSVAGISSSLLLISFSSTFASLLFFYLVMRVFTSFYHPIGIAMVSKTHPDRGLDFAMGIQSGSGNLGVFAAFISVGFLAQRFGWETPLYIWALVSFLLGVVSFLSVRKISTKEERINTPVFSSWVNTIKEMKKYIPGFVFGGACWGTTVYYAPSLLNHKFNVPLGKTGIYLAFWIGIGTVMTYLFGCLSRRFGRWRISIASFIGSSLFLFLLGISSVNSLALLSLFFFGAFLFLIFPAFQSSVGNLVSSDSQTLAFSVVANVQMLSGSIVVLISGFLSDKFGINSPFLLLAIMGTIISVYYLIKPPSIKTQNSK